MAALNPAFAGRHAVLQIKGHIGWFAGRRDFKQQGFGSGQREFGIDGVVLARGLVRTLQDARHFGQKDQLIGLQGRGHRGRDFFHR